MPRQPDFIGWNKLLSTIQDRREALGNPSVVWYRGVTSDSHELVPSLIRIQNGLEKESLLFHKYIQVASRVLEPRANDWEYLFDMQHHYLPTRLLDWTEVLGVALYFALLSNPSERPAIYILDPIKLNVLSQREGVFGDYASLHYRDLYWHNNPVKPMLPIAVEPPYQNQRIHGQRGKFTIHGNDPRALNVIAPACVKKVIIDREAREGAKEFLKLSGIDEFSVFPDIVGMVPFLKRIVGL